MFNGTKVAVSTRGLGTGTAPGPAKRSKDSSEKQSSVDISEENKMGTEQATFML